MNSGSGMTQESDRLADARDDRQSPAARNTAAVAHARGLRAIGVLARTVRDTVYAMVDALRGRYDC